MSQHTPVSAGDDSLGAKVQSIASSWPHPRSWNPGEAKSIADALAQKTKDARNQAIADYDTKVAANPSAKDDNKDPSKAVGAMAVLAIYGSDGQQIYLGAMFALGYKGVDPGDHAEALLIKWAQGILAGLGGKLVGATINMLIYVQKAPCAASCRPAIQEGTWLNQLYTSTGLPPGAATVNLAVFASGLGVPGPASFYFGSTQG